MTVYDTTCLYSTVKNISGKTMAFSCLPPHGVRLDPNEEITIFGNVLESVNRGDRSGKKHMDGLEAALAAGYLEIRNTPAPVLTDATTGDVQMLELNSGALGVVNPCWETSIGP